MRRRRVLAAAALVAAGSILADAAEGDLVLEAALEQRSVKLGEDAVLLLTLTNHTGNSMRTPTLRLARDSISVRVAAPGGVSAVVTRLYGTYLDSGGPSLDFKPTPSSTRKLESGESVQGRIAVPAVLVGELTLTAVLADGAPSHVDAKPVTVEVQGHDRVAVQVDTSRGGFHVDLDAAAAYGSVAAFWSLAKEGFFNGLTFHRVVAGALAQTGDPHGTGTGGPGWYVPAETPVATSSRGDVGLARGAPADSAGSQWFVVADGKHEVAGGYVRLGTVTDGLDVVDALAANEIDVKTGRPRIPDRVNSVKTIAR